LQHLLNEDDDDALVVN